MRRRTFIAGAGASLVGLVSYAHWLEPFWLDVTHHDLPVRSLPQSLIGKTLLHLSDLHIGPLVDTDYLHRVWAAGRALNPDLVMYTGDWVSWRGPTQLTQLESHLPLVPRGRMATLSVLGNHDYGYQWSELLVAGDVADRVSAAGIRMLRNESMEIDGCFVAGVDDYWSPMAKPEQALAKWKPGTPSLVLNHNPDCLDERERWHGYDGYVLAGHTHGGQCRSPFLAPPLIPVKNKQYTSGEIALPDGRRVYISRGVGFNVQIRCNVRPEITLFTLQRA
jgi:uncharacterized protein